MEYFQLLVPKGNGLCSDNECPCGDPGAVIPRGTGFMFISQGVVDFRQDARTIRDVEEKIKRIEKQLKIRAVFSQNTITSIVMCEQGAKKRGLSLDVAAADAKHWWKTGLVPLRATPLASVEKEFHESEAAISSEGPVSLEEKKGEEVFQKKLTSDKKKRPLRQSSTQKKIKPKESTFVEKEAPEKETIKPLETNKTTKPKVKSANQKRKSPEERCKKCGRVQKKHTTTCPHCGKTAWSTIFWCFFIGIFFLLLVNAIVLGGGPIFLAVILGLFGAILIFGSIIMIREAIKIRKTIKT